MIVVSNDFKNELRQPKTIDAKIVIGSSTITSNELNSIQRVFKTSLFKSVMKQVNVDSNTTIAKDSVINPQFGLYIGNAFEYVSLGSFKVKDEPILNKDTNSYEITSYDKIVESMIPYALDENDITYPCTVRQLFVAIFTKLGWATTGIPATFVNSTSNIEEDVFSNVNMTYRDVLDELCTISCMFLIDNGNPTLIQKKTTSEVINEYNMKNTNVAIKNRVFFNSLVFSRAEESDNIYRKDNTSIVNNGLHEFKVSDLQILSLNWRDNFIDAMWNYIKTFEYYSYDVDTYGITYLEPIDEFTLSIFNDTYTTLLLCSDLTISNGVKEKIYADEPVESETEYKYADTTDKKIKQTILIVDKQNQEITARITTDEQQISSLQLTTDAIQTNVTSTSENLSNQIQTLQNSTSLQINAINQTLEDGVEKLTNSLVKIDVNGINTSKDNETFNTQITNKTFEVKDGTNRMGLMGFDEEKQKMMVEFPEMQTQRLTNAYHTTEKIMEDGLKWSADYYVGDDN